METSWNQKGFSLVELLVTMVIMGLVMTSVYGLFINNQRTSVTSEEVVDVQQNLRVAYDMIARDIRMAGFAHADAIASVADNQVAIYTASPFNRYARVIRVEKPVGTEVGEITVNDTATYRVFIPYEHAKALRPGHVLRFCRPQDGTYVPAEVVTGTYFEVQAGSPAESSGEYYIDIARVAGSGPAINFEDEPNGDLLARVFNDYYPYDDDPSGAAPHVVVYLLEDDPDTTDPNLKRLMRIVRRTDGTGTLESQILATKIHDDPADPNDGLVFSYILDTNAIVAAAGVTDLGDVVGVQIRITGSTDVTRTGQENFSGVKTREIIGRAHLKNRSMTSGT